MGSEELVPLELDKILQNRTYTAVVLKSPTKSFAIFTEQQVGKVLYGYLTKQKSLRPSTHHLMHQLLKGFDIEPIQMVIVGLEDTVYYSRLFFRKKYPAHEEMVEIDVRPSDALILSAARNIPLFCRKDVLEKITPFSDQ